MFPVGALDKTDVREHARELGLPVAEKPDSHEICFVPDGDHAAFVQRHGRRRSAGRRFATSTARSSAGTGACTASPSANARGSDFPPPIPLYVLRHRCIGADGDGRPARGARARRAGGVRRQLDCRHAPAIGHARDGAHPPPPPRGRRDSRPRPQTRPCASRSTSRSRRSRRARLWCSTTERSFSVEDGLTDSCLVPSGDWRLPSADWRLRIVECESTIPD